MKRGGGPEAAGVGVGVYGDCAENHNNSIHQVSRRDGLRGAEKREIKGSPNTGLIQSTACQISCSNPERFRPRGGGHKFSRDVPLPERRRLPSLSSGLIQRRAPVQHPPADLQNPPPVAIRAQLGPVSHPEQNTRRRQQILQSVSLLAGVSAFSSKSQSIFLIFTIKMVKVP